MKEKFHIVIFAIMAILLMSGEIILYQKTVNPTIMIVCSRELDMDSLYYDDPENVRLEMALLGMKEWGTIVLEKDLAHNKNQKIYISIEHYINPVYVEAESNKNALLYDIRYISFEGEVIMAINSLRQGSLSISDKNLLNIYRISPLVTNPLQ